MSEEEKAERLALSEEAKKLRQTHGLTQVEAATAAGVPRGSIARLESGRSDTSYLQTYVEFLRTATTDELKTALEKAGYRAPKKQEPVPKKKAPKGRAPAIARELNAFRRRHDMSWSDLSDTLQHTQHFLRLVCKADLLPDPDGVAKLRAAMARYEKPSANDPRFTPSRTETRPADPPKPAGVQLVVDNTAGRRINNGENIAPLLRLDGKTMHVFTLVPGGVFVSYVEVAGA